MAYFTVSVAGLLVTLPAMFVTTAENREPLSPLTVGGVIYEDFVAPEMFSPFFLHW